VKLTLHSYRKGGPVPAPRLGGIFSDQLIREAIFRRLPLVDSWNQYANLLANQFRELHEDSPQRRELYPSGRRHFSIRWEGSG
jgi:hypothetical protein